MDSVGVGILLNFANMPSLKALTRTAQAGSVKRKRGAAAKKLIARLKTLKKQPLRAAFESIICYIVEKQISPKVTKNKLIHILFNPVAFMPIEYS